MGNSKRHLDAVRIRNITVVKQHSPLVAKKQKDRKTEKHRKAVVVVSCVCVLWE